MSKEQFKSSVLGNAETHLVRFINSDLVGTKLIIHHNLRVKYPLVAVYDNNDTQVFPDSVKSMDEDRVEVDLASYAPISGIWHARVVSG